MTTFYDTAWSYAQRGWSPIPLQPKKKEPFPGIPLKPYMREKPATMQKISAWGRRWPDANIGLATGKISGFFVLDCDSLEAVKLVRERGIPDTLSAMTGKGAHFYFAYPDFSVCNRTGILPGVDIRGDGGYVVAPPSIHPSGKIYQWGLGETIAPAPEWLLALLRSSVQVEKTLETGNPISRDSIVIHDLAAYRAAAFDKELAILRTTPEHQRNHQLNRSAFNLGQLVGAGILQRHNVESWLWNTARAIGLDEREIGPTLTSGLEDGVAQPRQIEIAHGDRRDTLPQDERKAVPVSHEADTETEDLPKRTDTGNAKRFVKRWTGRIRYVGAWKQWLVWDGSRWEQDETHAVMRAAKDTVLAMYREASEIQSDSTRTDYIKWALASESRAKLENMIALAQSEKQFATRAERLDTKPLLLNCKNCTIDLAALKVRDNDPKDLLTKRLEIEYDKTAKPKLWLKFLNRVMNGDQDMLEFIQRAVGYTLTGETSEQCLFFMIGTGKNGKSTFIETLLDLMGDYALKTPTETLMARDRSGVPNDVARLAGARLVVARETDESQRLAEATVKDLTGGDKITARYLHQEFFDFHPEFKLWMYGNHKPLVRGTDEGIWRRIRLIPFSVTIPSEEQDKDFTKKLKNELPGILNWALEGYAKWRKSGLGEPRIVREATQEYRTEMDMIGEFISDCFNIGLNETVTSGLLNEHWKAWCEDMGERAMPQRVLGLRLKERGFKPGRTTHGTRIWVGLSVKKKPDPIL